MRRERNILTVAVALLALARVIAWAAAPDEPGPFQVTEYREHLTDSSRDREMDLLVFYPDLGGESESRPDGCPLIVFNHGFLLGAEAYRSYGERLASHGLVVALPTFPMSFLNVHHVKLAEDVRFVLDHCLRLDLEPGGPLSGMIHEASIGASGHSLGGKLSLLEACTDGRIGAIAVLDPVDTGNPIFDNPRIFPSVAPELMPQMHVPLLFVGAELGKVLVTFSPCAPEKDNYQRFYEAANPPAIEVTQLGVGHGQYVDPGAEAATMSCAVGSVSDESVRASSVAYLTAFFLGHLSGDAAALEWLEARLRADEEAGRIVVRRK
jgi:dienelactone hydrolase